MIETFSSAAVLKQRRGICQTHGEVHAFTVSYHNDATTYRTPDLCGWCYVEAIERMTTHLQPLPEAAAEKGTNNTEEDTNAYCAEQQL